MNYDYSKQLKIQFDEAVYRTKESLKKEGFGVLTEIDVKKTLKEKLNADYDNYIILGACNPPFAYEALKTEKQIGLLLPCNVVVYEDDSEVAVSAILPTIAMSIVDNDNLIEIAKEVEKKLKKAVDSIT